jgi:hypothetical protein
MIDEFDFPPRVQEALDLVKRETARVEREARQAECSHGDTISVRAFSDPIDVRLCDTCGITIRDAA